MDINELRAAKRELESDLLDMISTRLDEFTKLTGVRPEGVSVSFVARQPFGHTRTHQEVSSVAVTINL